MKKFFSIVASLLMIISLFAPGLASAERTSEMYRSVNESQSTAEVKMSEYLLKEFNDEEIVTFLVKFVERADPMSVAEEANKNSLLKNLSAEESKLNQRSAVVANLKSVSFKSQQNVVEFLEKEMAKGNVEDYESFHIVNGMAVTATKEIAEKITDFAEVEKILPNEIRQLNETVIKDEEAPQSELANVEWSIERVNAPGAWAMGIDGSGTIVASIDTGVQWDHPALKEKYRGYTKGTGSVNHTYSWFDATNRRSAPYDDVGHGTHVTGTMVGSEPNGTNKIGVAPGAKWIAVRAFSQRGGTDYDILAAAEWILAPGGRVDMAPDVVNNSWGGGPGLDEWYRDVVKAWRAAEIFPEFSAGNTTQSNPGGPGSVAVPANYPESFATGAVDSNNRVANFSLRGPSPYGEVKPDITAPGVNIRSSVPGGRYEGGWNGTSMSGPAVSGVAALLRQAKPNISVSEMEEILIITATPLTDQNYPVSPNNGYGYGLVNAYKAVTNPVTRISGNDRYLTSIKISQNGWEKSDIVVLAQGNGFADALAGVPLAQKQDSPILLTVKDRLYQETLNEIKRLGAKNAIILGGPAAVSDSVTKALQKEGLKVERIAGADRFETAAKIALKVAPAGVGKAAVVNGLDFPDALSVASHAAKQGLPILLTQTNTLPKATKDAIDSLGVSQTIVVGGTTVVSNKVKDSLPAQLVWVERIVTKQTLMLLIISVVKINTYMLQQVKHTQML